MYEINFKYVSSFVIQIAVIKLNQFHVFVRMIDCIL